MRRGLLAAGALAVALALAGCAGSGTNLPGFRGGPATAEPEATQPPITQPPASATPTASTTASSTPLSTPASADPGAIVCGGTAVTINDASRAYTLSGDCPDVTIEGSKVSVTGPAVAKLTIRGTDNRIVLASVGPVSISGQNNTIAAGEVDTFAISGNGNRIDSSSTVTGGSFSGDNNQVHAPSGIGAVTNNGSGNYTGV